MPRKSYLKFDTHKSYIHIYNIIILKPFSRQSSIGSMYVSIITNSMEINLSLDKELLYLRLFYDRNIPLISLPLFDGLAKNSY